MSQGLTKSTMGSPPHARGKGVLGSRGSAQYRITPARAGKSTGDQIVVAEVEDHPRTRGEKDETRNNAIVTLGSPPHARGKDPDTVESANPYGITPARAGKSRR